MAKCEGATFARSLAFMPLINQDYLSPSLAKARPLRPPGGTYVYAYCVRCPPLARRSPRSLRSLISWSRRGLFVPYARKARPFCPQGGYMCLSLLCALPSIFREYSGD